MGRKGEIVPDRQEPQIQEPVEPLHTHHLIQKPQQKGTFSAYSRLLFVFRFWGKAVREQHR